MAKSNSTLRVAIGNDHTGLEVKEAIIKYLQTEGYDVLDFGNNEPGPDDYPDYGQKVAQAVQNHTADFGIAICGTGVGMSMVANKFEGVRASLCQEVLIAEFSRKHNNANVLTMGAWFTPPQKAIWITAAFLSTSFDGGRHQKRVDKIKMFLKNSSPTGDQS